MFGQGVIPDDWVDGEYCRYAVCWPNSEQWLAVLRGVLTMPAQGRFWDANTGSIIPAQEAIRETFDTNLHLAEVIMACNDVGLLEIASAIRSLQSGACCGDAPPANGGIQIIIEGDEGTNVVVYGSQPPGELTPGEVPPDYPGTVEEYDADKCRTAAAMVTAWISSIRNLASINFASSVGLTLAVIAAVAGLIVLPAFLIPILIAAAIGHVGINAALSSLADEMEANYNDLVCIFYTNSTTSVIANALADALDVIIATIAVTGAIGLALKTIALVLMNTDTINQLFTLTHGVGETFDCSECEESYPSWEIFDGFGEISTDGVGHWTATSTPDGGGHRLKFRRVGWPTAGATVEDAESTIVYSVSPGTDFSVYYEVPEDTGPGTTMSDPFDGGDFDGLCINAVIMFSWTGSFSISWTSHHC